MKDRSRNERRRLLNRDDQLPMRWEPIISGLLLTLALLVIVVLAILAVQ